jgi:hypothetical protein
MRVADSLGDVAGLANINGALADVIEHVDPGNPRQRFLVVWIELCKRPNPFDLQIGCLGDVGGQILGYRLFQGVFQTLDRLGLRIQRSSGFDVPDCHLADISRVGD